jgi:hypothetical protein
MLHRAFQSQTTEPNGATSGLAITHSPVPCERGDEPEQKISNLEAEEGMEPDDLLCSRNAHDKNVLVRRAQ